MLLLLSLYNCTMIIIWYTILVCAHSVLPDAHTWHSLSSQMSHFASDTKINLNIIFRCLLRLTVITQSHAMDSNPPEQFFFFVCSWFLINKAILAIVWQFSVTDLLNSCFNNGLVDLVMTLAIAPFAQNVFKDLWIVWGGCHRPLNQKLDPLEVPLPDALLGNTIACFHFILLLIAHSPFCFASFTLTVWYRVDVQTLCHTPWKGLVLQLGIYLPAGLLWLSSTSSLIPALKTLVSLDLMFCRFFCASVKTNWT